MKMDGISLFLTNLAESYERNSLEINASKNRALSGKKVKNRNLLPFPMVPSLLKDNEEHKRVSQGAASTLCDSNFENHQTSQIFNFGNATFGSSGKGPSGSSQTM